MNDEAHILACHHVSYGNHKIIAAPSAKMPTKSPEQGNFHDNLLD